MKLGDQCNDTGPFPDGITNGALWYPVIGNIIIYLVVLYCVVKPSYATIIPNKFRFYQFKKYIQMTVATLTLMYTRAVKEQKSTSKPKMLKLGLLLCQL